MSSAAPAMPVINVAVAVVQRGDGHVLLAERPRGKASAGFWEFPGGKFEPGENARQALARELHEELGVELDAAFPWLTYEHAYADKIVRLHFHRVLAWHGTPHGREGQRVSWQDPEALGVSPLLPANDKVLKALVLPPIYGITHAGKYGVPGFMERLQVALGKGLRLIQVRERRMTPEQLVQFTRRVVVLAHAYGARVLVNADESVALKTGADGIHVPSDQLMRRCTRPATRLWAASCHDAGELARASALGADFAVLSPVLPTSSHPGVPGMGWEKFAALARGAALPVFALGGMKPGHLDAAMHHGAHGVALLSDIWQR